MSLYYYGIIVVRDIWELNEENCIYNSWVNNNNNNNNKLSRQLFSCCCCCCLPSKQTNKQTNRITRHTHTHIHKHDTATNIKQTNEKKNIDKYTPKTNETTTTYVRSIVFYFLCRMQKKMILKTNWKAKHIGWQKKWRKKWNLIIFDLNQEKKMD